MGKRLQDAADVLLYFKCMTTKQMRCPVTLTIIGKTYLAERCRISSSNFFILQRKRKALPA